MKQKRISEVINARADNTIRLGEVELELAEIHKKAEDENREVYASDGRKLQSLEKERDDLRADIARADEAESALAQVPRSEGPHYGELGRTRGNLTYRPDTRFSYFGDLIARATRQDSEASTRLSQHAKEMSIERAHWVQEYRDLSIGGGFADFIPPIYLADEWAALARASRPLADAIGPRPLPETGMTLTVPKVTGGTTVASQAAEADAPSETDATDSLVSFGVKTIAGQQDLSIQLFERSLPGMDEVIAGDLAAAHAGELDRQIINGSDASGQVEGLILSDGINAVTYTEATPTAGMLYAKVANGVERIHSLRKLPPTLIVMAPRRWGFILSQRDTTGRPLVVNDGSRQNAMAAFPQVASEAMVGEMQGLPVLADGNIPENLGAATNEDRVFVLRTSDLLFYESTPRARVLQEVLSGTLQVRLQIYSYIAFTAERFPTSVSMLSGTGLVTPTFA